MAPAACTSRNRELLPILFRDEQLVAVHKPSGLLVHRTKLDSGERRFLLQMLRAQLRQRVYPVHRLDKGASGVMLFALQREVASALGEMVRGGRLHRTYVAVVRGLTPEAGEIDHPLAKQLDPAELRGDAAAVRGRPPRPTLTRYRRLASVELPHRVDRYATSRYSLLRLEPVTGRRHQLRRHLHHLSHPIIGDSTYGKGRHNRLFTRLFGCQRLLLACVELRFDHPLTGAPVTVTAPLADDLAPVLDGLGWTGQLPQAWRPAALGA
jgi:tRNA pseudouridine65 synthase